MRGFYRLFIILIAALPLASKASLYKFEYTGYVFYLTGGGLGYQLNDSVSGALTFDLANSSGDSWDGDYIVSYGAKNNSDFVQGYQSTNPGQNIDSVFVYDEADADYGVPRLYSGITIADANYVNYGPSGSRTYGLEVNIEFDNVDWLTNGQINPFSFGEADQLASTTAAGVFYDSRYVIDGNGNQSWPSEYAWFRLNSAKLSVVDVPEPSALLLLISGGLVLFLRRRFLNG